MAGLGIFSPSTLGMRSGAHQLNVIGFNIANVNTAGFKRKDVQFETVLSDNLFQQSDTGGVVPKTTNRISDQGFLSQTQRQLDVAISGAGFFQLSPTLEVGTDIFYTRDGSFQINTVRDPVDPTANQTTAVTQEDGSTLNVDNGYLVDSNGMFLLGVSADPTTGEFLANSTVAPMRVDPAAFTNQGSATTRAKLSLNLPAEKEAGDPLETFTIEAFDSNFTSRAVNFDFIPTTTDNQWLVSPRADGATALALAPGTPFSVTTGTAVDPTLRMQSNTLSVLGTNGLPTPGRFLGLSKGDTVTVGGFTDAANNGTFTVNSVATNGSSITLDGTPVVSTGPSETATAGAGSQLSFTRVLGAGAVATTNTIKVLNAEGAVVGGGLPGAVVGQKFTVSGTQSNNGTFTIAAINADGSVSVAESVTNETDSTGATVTKSFVDENVTTAATVSSTKTIGEALTFNPDGTISTPTSYTLTATWDDGATSSFTVDFSDSTQFAGGFNPFFSEANGNLKSDLATVRFDDDGNVVGTFADGTDRSIYKLPLAFFVNPDSLATENGMVFSQSADSGGARSEFADISTGTSMLVGALELSNVDIAQEFSRMIQAQHAYNLNATTFRTVDEMSEVARDLKR